MYVCASRVFLVPVEDRGEHQRPWNGNYKDSKMLHRYWKLNLGPLEEQAVVPLTSGISFHSNLCPSFQKILLPRMKLGHCNKQKQRIKTHTSAFVPKVRLFVLRTLKILTHSRINSQK